MRAAASLLVVGALLTPTLGSPQLERYDNLTEEEAAKVWIEEIVPYIATKQERSLFKSLQTSEERVSFIDTFWARRDPTPETPENEYKLEHYRRLAFVNKFFGAGRPGFKSDRGRIYILLGPPNDIDSDPMGRLAHQYPTEVWLYNQPPHPLLPLKLEIAFVDRNLTGEYELTFQMLRDADASRRTEMLLDDGFLDQMARAEIRHMNFGRPGTLRSVADGLNPELTRLNEMALVSQIPQRQLRSLSEEVKARVSFDAKPLAADPRIDFYRASEGRLCIPVTLRLAYRDFAYLEKPELYEARFDIFGRILTLEGETVDEFSRQEFFAVPKDQLQDLQDQSLLYQLILYAPPGEHDLELVLRDNSSNSIRMAAKRLAVPDWESSLSLSSVVLADQILELDQPSPPGKKEPFTFGRHKVLPNPTSTFKAGGSLSLYFEVYNLALDEEGKNWVQLKYTIRREGRLYRKPLSTYPYPTNRGNRAIMSNIPLKDFTPGGYTITVALTDQVSGDTASIDVPFHVR